MTTTPDANDRSAELPQAQPLAEPEAAPTEPALPATNDPSQAPPFTHTRLSGYWAAIVASLVVLVVLIIFILENGQRAKVSFFGAHGHLPEGVALLLAAVIGGLVVAVAGIARILQLRSRARRSTARGAGGGGHGRRRRTFSPMDKEHSPVAPREE